VRASAPASRFAAPPERRSRGKSRRSSVRASPSRRSVRLQGLLAAIGSRSIARHCDAPPDLPRSGGRSTRRVRRSTAALPTKDPSRSSIGTMRRLPRTARPSRRRSGPAFARSTGCSRSDAARGSASSARREPARRRSSRRSQRARAATPSCSRSWANVVARRSVGANASTGARRSSARRAIGARRNACAPPTSR